MMNARRDVQRSRKDTVCVFLRPDSTDQNTIPQAYTRSGWQRVHLRCENNLQETARVLLPSIVDGYMFFLKYATTDRSLTSDRLNARDQGKRSFARTLPESLSGSCTMSDVQRCSCIASARS